MRWMPAGLFLFLWLLGLYAGAGPFIHLLLFFAIALGLISFFAGRRNT